MLTQPSYSITFLALVTFWTAATTAGEQPFLSLESPTVATDADDNAEDKEDERNIFGLPMETLTEPIVTDRPDFTESTDAVPYGHLQLEMGYTFTHDREHRISTREHTVPEFLLRVGMVKNVEFRFGWEGYTYSHTREKQIVEGPPGHHRTVMVSDWAQGGNDLSLGAKFKLLEQKDLCPHFGVITEMTIPSGSPNVTGGQAEPAVVLLWGYDLTDRLGVAGNVGFIVPQEDKHRFLQTTSSVSFAYAWTERWGSYLEYFGFYPDAIDEKPAHNVNTGVTYLITDNFQIDFRVGFGLNRQAPDMFTGVGLAWRF